MGLFLQEKFPLNFQCIDIFQDGHNSIRCTRKATRAALQQLSRKQSVVFIALPLTCFQKAMAARGERARLIQLMGISGSGQNETLIVHLSSLHSQASSILDAMAGPTLGLHLLHGPSISDLSNETAVITTTPYKARHHLQLEATSWLNTLLNNVGYASVHDLLVDRHDLLMANIQFLRHSMFLVAAHAVRLHLDSQYYDPSLLLVGLVRDILEISQRIFSGKCDVYKNIACLNPYNEKIFEAWMEAVKHIRGNSLEDVLVQLFQSSQEIIEAHFGHIGVNAATRRQISTPVSRACDGLMRCAHGVTSGENGGQIKLAHSLQDYKTAIDQNRYIEFFSNLQAFSHIARRINQKRSFRNMNDDLSFAHYRGDRERE